MFRLLGGLFSVHAEIAKQELGRDRSRILGGIILLVVGLSCISMVILLLQGVLVWLFMRLGIALGFALLIVAGIDLLFAGIAIALSQRALARPVMPETRALLRRTIDSVISLASVCDVTPCFLARRNRALRVAEPVFPVVLAMSLLPHITMVKGIQLGIRLGVQLAAILSLRWNPKPRFLSPAMRCLEPGTGCTAAAPSKGICASRKKSGIFTKRQPRKRGLSAAGDDPVFGSSRFAVMVCLVLLTSRVRLSGEVRGDAFVPQETSVEQEPSPCSDEKMSPRSYEGVCLGITCRCAIQVVSKRLFGVAKTAKWHRLHHWKAVGASRFPKRIWS